MQTLRTLPLAGLAFLFGACQSQPPQQSGTVSLRIDHCPSPEEIASWQRQEDLVELMIWTDGEGFAIEGPPPKRFGDEDLRQLASIPQLRRLTIGGWDMAYSDMGLQALAAIGAFRALEFVPSAGSQ